jgi:hypothetical protein
MYKRINDENELTKLALNLYTLHVKTLRSENENENPVLR